MPLVKIKPDVTHRVDGELLKAGDEFDASPAEMESFGDKFTVVILAPDESEPLVIKVDATAGARKLAAEHDLSLALSGIIGTGQDGKIVHRDVKAFLNGDAE